MVRLDATAIELIMYVCMYVCMYCCSMYERV